jgi:hypothetical protein
MVSVSPLPHDQTQRHPLPAARCLTSARSHPRPYSPIATRKKRSLLGAIFINKGADANRNSLISISELTGYLTRHVPGLTNGAQHPGVEMRFDGNVFVAGL